MFDTTIQTNKQTNHQEVNVNEASTGQLTRISKTSKLIRFQKGSQMEKQFFCDEPYVKKTVREWHKEFGVERPYDSEEYYDIDILQVLVFGDNQYLVEYEIGEKRW